MAEETFSTNLLLPKPDVGGQNNAWGATLNTALDYLDDFVAGYLAKSVAGGADVTLSEAEFRNKTIKMTGTLTANINVIVPTREFAKWFWNATDGAFTVTVKTSAGSGVAVSQGYKSCLLGDGTNVVQIIAEAVVPSLASTTVVLTGTDAAKTATPDAIAALWEAGADNAGDGTITMGEGASFNLITSVVAITAFAFTTDKAGRKARIRFNTARVLTHNATSLILPTAANITTVQGDLCEVESLGSGNFRVNEYTKADGTPLSILTGNLPAATTTAKGAVELAIQAEVQAATDAGRVAALNMLINHPGVAKAGATFAGADATIPTDGSFNITSITRVSAGLYEVTLAVTMANNDFQVVPSCTAVSTNETTINLTQGFARTTTVFRLTCKRTTDDPQDPAEVCFMVFGKLA